MNALPTVVDFIRVLRFPPIGNVNRVVRVVKSPQPIRPQRFPSAWGRGLADSRRFAPGTLVSPQAMLTGWFG